MKNRGLFILIIFAVLSVSAPSEAVNWLYIGGREGISLHVDTDTVTEAADGVKEAWFMLQYNPPDCTSDYAKRLNKCVQTIPTWNGIIATERFACMDLFTISRTGLILDFEQFLVSPKRSFLVH